VGRDLARQNALLDAGYLADRTSGGLTQRVHLPTNAATSTGALALAGRRVNRKNKAFRRSLTRSASARRAGSCGFAKLEKGSDRALQQSSDVGTHELSARSGKRVEIQGCEGSHVVFRTVSMRFGAMAASLEVRLTKLLGQLFREIEGDLESVRRPDRQNAKIVGR
jgi:hypothetical protein